MYLTQHSKNKAVAAGAGTTLRCWSETALKREVSQLPITPFVVPEKTW